MKLEITVTEEDIEAGKNFEGVYDSCPIAQALKKVGCERIDADEDRILLTYHGNRYLFKTPRPVMLFISDFDCGREQMVKPFEFVLDQPKIATLEDERKPVTQMKWDHA